MILSVPVLKHFRVNDFITCFQRSQPPGTSGTQRSQRSGTAGSGLSALSEGGESQAYGTEVR